MSGHLTLSFGTMAYWERPGANPPLVLIHGNSASKAAFRRLFEADALEGIRLIALDLPGCGESDNAADPQATYTLPGLGAVVAEAVARLNLGPAILVGWSLGGHAVIEALAIGAQPAGVVLTGTPPCGPSLEELGSTFLPAEGAAVVGMESPTPEELSAYVKTLYWPSIATPEFRHAAERADGRLRRRMFEHIYEGGADCAPQRATVAAWTGPMAVIQGGLEPFFDPKGLDRLKWGNLWRGQGQWVEGAGHAPFNDDPDRYAELLAAFRNDVIQGLTAG
ncbi:MAG: alpha/beta hydrolase [Caulobacteraceae bacterium]|nr:alpha/beta hydrolase [Caulobacteraceae bacterium]